MPPLLGVPVRDPVRGLDRDGARIAGGVGPSGRPRPSAVAVELRAHTCRDCTPRCTPSDPAGPDPTNPLAGVGYRHTSYLRARTLRRGPHPRTQPRGRTTRLSRLAREEAGRGRGDSCGTTAPRRPHWGKRRPTFSHKSVVLALTSGIPLAGHWRMGNHRRRGAFRRAECGGGLPVVQLGKRRGAHEARLATLAGVGYVGIESQGARYGLPGHSACFGKMIAGTERGR
jgi:hypothetical protein